MFVCGTGIYTVVQISWWQLWAPTDACMRLQPDSCSTYQQPVPCSIVDSRKIKGRHPPQVSEARKSFVAKRRCNVRLFPSILRQELYEDSKQGYEETVCVAS